MTPNPANNLGQQNTDVQALNSPNAQFTFPVANRVRTARRVTLRADAYDIPEAGPCGSGEEAAALRRRRVASQQIGAQTWPSGWNVTITPSSLDLQPGEEQTVTVDVEAPDGFVGAQSFNVNASADGTLIGGVTLTVHS
jgi:hypothetical protein